MKQIISQYTFNKNAKTVTFTDFAAIKLDRVLLITNVTRGVALYQFNDQALGGSVAGNVLTLILDTSGMDDADTLQIFYDTEDGDPVYEPATPVNQGDLSDMLDTIAVRGMSGNFSGYSASSATTLIEALDVSKYATVVVRLSGTWTATVQFEYSLDGTTFSFYNTVGTNGMYVLPCIGSSFRVTVIAYTSGTITATVQLFAFPLHIGAGNVAVAVPPHAVYVGMRNNIGNLAGLESASSIGDGGSGNALLGIEGFGFNGTNHDRRRFANILKTVSTTAAGDTAVWTPVTGRRFRLMGYSLEATANVAQAAAGVVTVKLRDAANDLNIAHDIFVPQTAATVFGPGFTSGFVQLSNGKVSAAVNNTLHINLSAALTSGNIRLNVMGTEE